MGYAPLEIHHINVGQGDSTLIINRNLENVKEKITKANKQLPGDSPDWMPFAVANKVSLKGTVKCAMLIDGSENRYDGDLSNQIKTYGVIKKEMRCLCK